MNTISLHQIQPLQPNQLFYLPKDQFNREKQVSKFIKLFKNNLHKQNPNKHAFSKNQQKSIPPKSSFKNHGQNLKTYEITNETKSIRHQNQTAIDILSERQKLVKEIIRNNQTHETIKPRKKTIQYQRCKTLQNNQTVPQQEIIETKINSSKKFKIPAKFRMTFSKNKPKAHSNSLAFPNLDKKSSTPQAKKLTLSNIQVINKYRQFQQKYRSKQFLSIPISISSVTNSNRKKSQTQPRTSKNISNSLIYSKNSKIKIALQSFSNQTFLPYDNPQNQMFLPSQNQLKEKNQLFFSEFSMKKQRKTVQIKKKLQQKQKNHQIQTKLKQKLPLDDYFKPWQNSQFVKQQNVFISQNCFN